MRADAEQIADFLRSDLFSEAIRIEVPGFIGCSAKTPGGLWSSATFPLADIPMAARWLATRNDAGQDVYVRQTLLDARPAIGRGTKESTGWLVGVWADIDVEGPGHVAKNLPGTISEAVLISDALLPASIIVNSGGGLYGYWLFDQPLDVREPHARIAAEELTRSWCIELARTSHRHVDQVGDFTRVLRPPGSVSYKRAPTLVTIQRQRNSSVALYTPHMLRTALPPPAEALTGYRTHGRFRTTTASNNYGPGEALHAVADLSAVLAEDGVFGPWHEVHIDTTFSYWKYEAETSNYALKQRHDNGIVIIWSSAVASQWGLAEGEGHSMFTVYAAIHGMTAQAKAHELRQRANRRHFDRKPLP